MADNTTLNTGTGGDVIATDDIAGVKHQRVKIEYGADGTAIDVSEANPMPVFMVDTAATPIQFWATGAASGATGVETLITLTRSPSAGGATASGSSYTVTTAKRLRITSITFASRGNATATAQVTTFTVRVNTAGAITTTSNAWVSGRTATPATALAWDRLVVPLGADGMEIAGNGTIQFGVSANAVFTTNAPTWDVLITGYEY